LLIGAKRVIDHRDYNTSRVQGFCAPEPLAGPDCSDTENFRHIDNFVNSKYPMAKLLGNYNYDGKYDFGDPISGVSPGYGLGMDYFYYRPDYHTGSYHDFLRPGAKKQIIFVTDDLDLMSYEEFKQGLADMFIDDYTIHAVVGLVGKRVATGCYYGIPFPLRDHNRCEVTRGQSYIDGAEETDGGVFDVCDVEWCKVVPETKPLFGEQCPYVDEKEWYKDTREGYDNYYYKNGRMVYWWQREDTCMPEWVDFGGFMDLISDSISSS
ncbi:MAG: hypothetical protein GY854_07250, partial [Deltaproteobacteria bacterium]|nr:hypothetical protein [Deltaproteobacteria bacterium]